MDHQENMKKGGDAPLNSNIISPSDFGRSLMKARDLFSQHYRHIGPNERPFTGEIIALNNGLLEEWKDEILYKLSDKDGLIETEIGCISLKVFMECKEAISLNEEYAFYENGERIFF